MKLKLIFLILIFTFIIKFNTYSIKYSKIHDLKLFHPGETKLMKSIRNKSKDYASLIDEISINETDAEGWTPLMYALFYNNFVAAEQLLKQGADVNIKNKSDWTALMYSITTDVVDDKIFNTILNKTDNINSKNIEGRTALILAASWSKTNVIKILIDLGADINHFDIYGNNCFIYALSKPFNDILDLLLQNGVKINYFNKMDDTPISFFIKTSHHRTETLEKLIEYGADINLINNKGRNVLIIELHKKYIYTRHIKALIENGININVMDIYGKTALDYAINMENKTIIDLLNTFDAKTGEEISSELDDAEQKYGDLSINFSDNREAVIKIDNIIFGKTNEKIQIPMGIHDFIIENNKNISIMTIEITENKTEINDPVMVSKKYLKNKLKHTFNAKEYRSDMFYATGEVFSLIGVIFPLTNIIGYPYFMNETARMLAVFSMLIFGIPSFLSTTASFITFGIGCYYNFELIDTQTSQSLFISSAVCISVSYLINLVVGIILFSFEVYSIGRSIDNWKKLKKTRLRLLEKLMIDVSQEEVNISCKIKL